MSENDRSLYGALKEAVEKIVVSDLTWRDPVANMVLSDDSDIVKDLKRREKYTFMVRSNLVLLDKLHLYIYSFFFIITTGTIQ